MNEHSSPHILCINHEFPPVGGGAATATLHIAREMARQGLRVTVLTGSNGQGASKDVHEGFTLWRIPAMRTQSDASNPFEMITFLLSSCWWALRHGGKNNYSATIAFFGLPAGPAAWILRVLYSIPYIISLRGGDVPGFLPHQLGRWHALTGWLIRFLWKKSCAVVANSEGLAALASRDGQRVLVIPNGVDAERFVPAPPPGQSVQPVQAVQPVTHLLHVGRLNKQKSLDTLLHALPQLRGNWQLSLAGDGPEAAHLQTLAQQLGLTDKIHFLGWQQRECLPQIYTHAHIFIFPSVEEGMPNAMLEAMSCGLPVVACRVTGCEELVEPDRTGLLVAPRDAAALVAALQTLLDDPDGAQSMGHAGRQRVLKHFSWRHTAQSYALLCTEAHAPHA